MAIDLQRPAYHHGVSTAILSARAVPGMLRSGDYEPKVSSSPWKILRPRERPQLIYIRIQVVFSGETFLALQLLQHLLYTLSA